MTDHFEGSIKGQQICDIIFTELHQRLHDLGGAERKHAKDVCSIGPVGHRNIVYIYHNKKKDTVRIYIEGDQDEVPNNFPSKLSISVRKKISGSWQKKFPFYFELGDVETAKQVAAVLAERLSLKDEGNQKFKQEEGFLPEEIILPEFWEGAGKKIFVNRYERDAGARKYCLEKWGTSCCVCGIDFGKVYGPEFDDFIHVHHLIPIADIKKAYKLNPVQDLRPVCPNCHSIIHRRNPPYSIDELRNIMRR